jgi:hypothetical protein
MADVPLTLGSQTIPAPQLPASNSKSWQRPNCISSLSAHQPTRFIPLSSTALHWITELGRSSHIALEQTHREHRLQHLFYCSVTSPRAWRIPLLQVHGPLPSNSSTCYIDPSLRLLVQNRLNAYLHFFFSEGCACDVCNRPRITSQWHGSHCDYSPSAPAAPSLRQLVPSGSLIRCDPVQMYHHQSRCTVPLHPVCHIIYPGDYLVWALTWDLEIGRFTLRAGWMIEPHFAPLMGACAVGQSVVTSFHPVTGSFMCRLA